MFAFIKAHSAIISLAATIITVVGVVAFIYWAGGQVASNKAEIRELKANLEAAQKEYETFKGNVITVDNIAEYAKNTVHTQQIIRERIQNVEVKGEDRPYVDDPGLLERARIMREYQQAYRSDEVNIRQ